MRFWIHSWVTIENRSPKNTFSCQNKYFVNFDCPKFHQNVSAIIIRTTTFLTKKVFVFSGSKVKSMKRFEARQSLLERFPVGSRTFSANSNVWKLTNYDQIKTTKYSMHHNIEKKEMIVERQCGFSKRMETDDGKRYWASKTGERLSPFQWMVTCTSGGASLGLLSVEYP